MAPLIQTVGELTRALKTSIEGRFALVAVRGEISNFKAAPSGHLYFTLKDEAACLQAVIWKPDAARLKFRPKDGLSVIAQGRLVVYEPRGQYQLVCDQLEPEGAGALALAFEQLKAKLAAEGLFEPGRKRPIPFLPRAIGVVTSPTGAALQDFWRVLSDRFPIPVLVAPSRVQGEGAAEEIARGIERLDALGTLDVIVVTRGGGSIEDLWAFNEEVVARAIASSRTPVVSAVGHEVDFTIADFVADRRCATPTDAAKLLAPPREELARQLDKQRRHLRDLAHGQIARRRERMRMRQGRLVDPRRGIDRARLLLDDTADRLEARLRRSIATEQERLRGLRTRLDQDHPRARLNLLSGRLSALDRRLALAGRERFSRERARLGRLVAALQSLSPLSVMGRGYAIAFTGEEILRSAHEVGSGDPIRLLLSDRSELHARVVDSPEPPH